MKYLIKFISEFQYEIETASTDDAVKYAREALRQMPSGTKLHGVVREDIGWPDTNTEAQRPLPPRGGPPSGTPGAGTPGLPDQEEFVFERVAA